MWGSKVYTKLIRNCSSSHLVAHPLHKSELTGFEEGMRLEEFKVPAATRKNQKLEQRPLQSPPSRAGGRYNKDRPGRSLRLLRS